jgi:hypothetical protein
MVNRKTFYERDFFTMFQPCVWIFETSCKILSINDLQAQGGWFYKLLINNNLQNLILRQNLNEGKRSKLILRQKLNERLKSKLLIINYLQEPLPRARKPLITNDLHELILEQKLNEAERSGLFVIRLFPIYY